MKYIVKGYCPLTGKDVHLVCNSRQQAESMFSMCNRGTLSLGKRLLKTKGETK